MHILAAIERIKMPKSLAKIVVTSNAGIANANMLATAISMPRSPMSSAFIRSIRSSMMSTAISSSQRHRSIRRSLASSSMRYWMKKTTR